MLIYYNMLATRYGWRGKSSEKEKEMNDKKLKRQTKKRQENTFERITSTAKIKRS